MAGEKPVLPIFPSDEVWRGLVADLKLNPRQANELEWAIKYALLDLETLLARHPDRAARRSLVARLARFRTALQSVIDDLVDGPDDLKKILPLEARDAIGIWLADEAMRRKGLQFDDATVHDEQRKDVGLDEGFELLVQALTEIRAPIDHWLAGEGRDPGGRQRNIVRDVLIIDLADKCEAIIDTAATPTAGGPFTELCSHTFFVLNISCDGIEDAIARALRMRSKAKHAGGEPSGS